MRSSHVMSAGPTRTSRQVLSHIALAICVTCIAGNNGALAADPVSPPVGATPAGTPVTGARQFPSVNPVSPQHGPTGTAPSGAAASQPAGDGPRIVCDEATFNFPEVWTGDKLDHTFILKNTGKKTLEITAVRPSCGCTAAPDWSKKIEPGQQGKADISINTQHLKGEVTKMITIESNDPVTPRFMITMKGKIKTAVEMNPPTGFSWAQITPQSPDHLVVTLTNNLDKPWKLALKPDPAQQAVFDVQIKETDPGKKAEVTTTLKKPLKEGSNYVQLTFTTGLEKQGEIQVPANYFLPPALQVQPPTIYGITVPGQDFVSVLSVAYTREGEMKVLSATPTDPTIKADVQPNPTDKQRYTIRVTIPKDFKVDQNPPPSIDIKTDKTDLANKGIVSVPIRIRPQSTQPAVAPPDSGQFLVGKPAPEVVLKGTAGADIKVGGKTGAVTLIDFWATWCGHCKQQVPILADLMKTYGAKGVKLVSVSVDAPRQNAPTLTPQNIADIAKQMGEDMPIALDPIGDAFPKMQDPSGKVRMYGGGGIPMLFVVSKEGIIEAYHRGDLGPGGLELLKKELDTLLAGKTLPRPVLAANPMPNPVPPPVTPSVPQVKGPSLQLDSLRQEVGMRKPGENAPFTFNLRNNGSEPVQITSLKPGSDAVVVSPESAKSVAPGATAAIKLEIKMPTKPGAFTQTLALQTSDPKHANDTITLSATVRPYLEVQPAAGVTFPRSGNIQLQSVPSIATLVWNGEGKIEYSKPESNSPKFEGEIQPIQNGPYAKLIVKAKPPLEAGENKAKMHIKTSSKEQPEIDVPVSYFVPPRIEITPTEVLLTPNNRFQRSMVTIRNNGEKSLSILSVKSSTDKIRTQFFPEADGLSYKLWLVVPGADQNSGTPSTEKVTIRTDDAEFGEITIPIKFNASAAANAIPR